MVFIDGFSYINFYDIVSLILNLINVLYIFNILFKQGNIKFMTNKVFAIANIVICLVIIFKSGFSWFYILYYLVYLLKIPYFYNYYELLKGSKENV